MRERYLAPARTGGRLLPVRDLAAELGVCVRTVLAAQKILAARGELEIRHGSGVYVPERRGPQWVGIFTAFDILQPRASSFHLRLPYELGRYLEQNGLRTEVYIGGPMLTEQDPPSSCARLVADAAAGRLDGLAILSCSMTRAWQEWVAALRVPAVGGHTPYRVDAGYPDFVHWAVRRLCDQGCRRIAMLSYAGDGLREPLRDALSDCGLDYRPEWVRSDLDPKLAGAGWELFREAWTARRERPDGILVMDDVLFNEAVIAIQEMGIAVPGRLKIVTHANKCANRRYPFPVSEAVVDPTQYAEALGAMLLKRMRGEPVEPSVAVVPIELIETRPVAAPIRPEIVPHAAGGGGSGQ